MLGPIGRAGPLRRPGAHALALGAGGRVPFEPLATLASDWRRPLHRRGSVVTADLLALGPELVVNGGFDDGTTTGWGNANLASLSNPGGRLRLTLTSPGAQAPQGRYQITGLTVGKVYAMSAACVGYGGAGLNGTQPFTAKIRNAADNADVLSAASATVTLATVSGTFVATETSCWVRVRLDTPAAADLTTYYDIDNVSVREVLTGAQYARSGATRWEGASWLAFAANVPPVVPGEGVYIRPQIQNKCTNWNVAPTDTAGMTVTNQAGGAGVLSVVDDTAALQAAGFGTAIADGRMNGKVYKFDNSAGTGFSRVNIPGAVGNLNPSLMGVYARVESAASMSFIWNNGSANGATDISRALGVAYQRVAASLTPDATSRTMALSVGAGTVLYFIANHLIEASADPGCIIPVAGAAATANADALTQAVDPLPSEFTVLWEGAVAALPAGGGTAWLYQFHDGTDNNRIVAQVNGPGAVNAFVTISGVTTTVAITAAGVVAAGALFKAALRRSGGNWRLYVNGAAVGADAPLAVPAVSTITHGSRRSGSDYLNGRIARFAQRPYAMTDAEIAAW